MKALLEKWRQLSQRHRHMLVLALLLIVLVLVKYIDFSGDTLPLPHVMRARRSTLVDRQRHLAKLVRARERHDQTLARLQSRIAPQVWRMSDKVPATEVQGEVDRLARLAHVTIQTMGGQRVSDVGNNLRNVELTVNLTGSMRDISRFLAVLDSAERRFYWRSCRLRPANARVPGSISLSGRLQAFYYTPEAERLLFGMVEREGQP